MTKRPINLTDLLHQHTVEGERIEYKNRRKAFFLGASGR